MSMLQFIEGDEYAFTVTVKVPPDGVALNITGATVTMTARTAFDAAAVFTKTVGDGITLTTPTSGIMDIVIPGTDTTNLGGTALFYDIEVIVGGLTHTVLRGSIDIRQGVV
jgi:hypothetical protein